MGAAPLRRTLPPRRTSATRAANKILSYKILTSREQMRYISPLHSMLNEFVSMKCPTKSMSRSKDYNLPEAPRQTPPLGTPKPPATTVGAFRSHRLPSVETRTQLIPRLTSPSSTPRRQAGPCHPCLQQHNERWRRSEERAAPSLPGRSLRTMQTPTRALDT